MTHIEYQSFKFQFHCTSMSDEGYSGPFEVESEAGDSVRVVYVAGSQFAAAHAWLRDFKRSKESARSPAL